MKKLILNLLFLTVGTGSVSSVHASLSKEDKILIGIGAGLIAIPTVVMPMFNWAKEKMTSDEEAFEQMRYQYENIECTYARECFLLNNAGSTIEDLISSFIEEKIDSLIVSNNVSYTKYHSNLCNTIAQIHQIQKRLHTRLSRLHSSYDKFCTMYHLTSLITCYENLNNNMSKFAITLNTLKKIVSYILEAENDRTTYHEVSGQYIKLQQNYCQEERIITQDSYSASLSESEILKIAQIKGFRTDYRYSLVGYEKVISYDIQALKKSRNTLKIRLEDIYKRYKNLSSDYYPLAQHYEILLKEVKNYLFLLQDVHQILIQSSSYRSESHFKAREEEMRRTERELKREVEHLKQQVKEYRPQVSQVKICLQSNTCLPCDAKVNYSEIGDYEICNPFND
jgi:hypothetical protein